jgi:hypothetical protein
MGQREVVDMDDEVVLSKLVDELSGCDIGLREMYREAPEVFEASLRFDQLVKLKRQ